MRPRALALLALLATSSLAQDSPVVRWMAGGHGGIQAVDVSAQGLVATGSGGDHTIKLWDAAGRLVRTLAAHAEAVNAVAFSPDGTLLASGGGTAIGSGDVNVKLWSVADGLVLRTFGLPDEPSCQAVAFSPDASLLAIGRENGQVEIRRVADGSLARTIDAHSWAVFDVEFSPDGALVASASGDRLAKLWRVADGSLAHELAGHSFFVSSLAFSPDGTRLLTGSWDMTLKTWDVATGGLVRTLTGEPDAVNAVAWSPDGLRLASGDSVAGIHVWDAATGADLRTLTDASVQSAIQSVRFDSASTIVGAGSDGHARRWDADDGRLLRSWGHHVGRVGTTAFTSDGRVVTGSADMLAKVFAVADGTPQLDLRGHSDLINAVAVTPDATLVATAAGSPPPDTRDATVRLWSLADGSLVRTLAGHPGGSFAAAFSPDGLLLATGGQDGRARLWSVADGSVAQALPHADPVQAVAWTPDGATVLTGAGTTLSWWRASDGSLVRSVPATAGITALAVSPDGSLVAASLAQYGSNVATWRVADGGLDRTFGGHVSFAQGVAFLADGATLLSTSGFDGDLRAWNVADGAMRWIVTRECGWGPGPMLCVAVSPDGRHVAWGRQDATLVVAAFDGCGGVPGEVPTLTVGRPFGEPRDTADLAWSDPGAGLVSDVLTGVVRELRADAGFARASCLGQDVASASLRDARPPPGRSDGWWYLVRAQDCDAGPWGSGTFGPRAIDAGLCP